MGSVGRQVVIALGTNMGDRGRNAWWAIQQLLRHDIQTQRCSALYETAAAYVTDQPPFLNAAVLGRTELPPRELLRTLKQIEEAAGRDVQGGPRWGPRPLDLDIIFMDGQPYLDDKLQVPHPRWHEREFVFKPVSDLWYVGRDSPGTQRLHSGEALCSHQLEPQGTQHHAAGASSPAASTSALQHTYQAYLKAGLSTHQASGAGAQTSAQQGAGMDAVRGGATAGGKVMRRVTPVGKHGRMITWGERTLLMGILNVTPDSFSDGGLLLSRPGAAASPTQSKEGNLGVGSEPGHVDVQLVVQRACQMAKDGADVLDVGGQSTRPGAVRVSKSEELSRVIPVIRALRSCQELQNTLISVDTFCADVAAEAVMAGADIVNDVSGGRLDPDMLTQVSRLGVPYIMMHMRGDPSDMHLPHNTHYSLPVWQEVGQELQAAADACVAAGIPAWNIITDPGIGFAKTSSGNIDLLRDLPLLRSPSGLQGALVHGPMLVGPSRKRFLGQLTGRSAPAERDAATVAACVVCVQGGADILRVHNVKDVNDGLKVADAIFRPASQHKPTA